MVFRASLFCFQEKQASRAKTSHSQALLVRKKTKDILVRLEPRDLKAPKERKGQDGTGTSGVNYVRWGRTSCPNGTETVYQGKKNRWSRY